MKAKVLPVLSILFLVLVSFSIAEEGHHHEITAEQLGSVSFPTSCEDKVQDQIQRGVAWLYSFEYEQTGREFETVAKADPKCAMAYWGQAMSLWHQLWSRPDKEDIYRGAELLEKARALEPATQRERDYIDALALFYSGDDPMQYTQRVKAYSDAMDQLRQNNPQDREAAVFYALSLLALDDGNDPSLALQRKAVEVLNGVLHDAPNHPGVTHYIIHATDNPQLASMGLEAARVYARIAPASAHAVHMPSHIFARLGLWQDDIKSNLAAIAVADQMEGFHTAHHRLHSMDFLLSAYLQIGDDRNAKAQIDALKRLPKDSTMPDYSDYYQTAQVVFPATFALERRQWKEAIAIAPDPATPPYVQAYAYWAQAVGAGHLKDAKTARVASDKMLEMIAATSHSDKSHYADYLEMERDEANAWALYAEGRTEDAIRLLRTVADKQDKVGKGETALPAREMMADILLDSDRADEALQEYEIALKTDPNRFNGLYGAARAAEMSHQDQKAQNYYAQLLKNCAASHSNRPELAQAKAIAAAK